MKWSEKSLMVAKPALKKIDPSSVSTNLNMSFSWRKKKLIKANAGYTAQSTKYTIYFGLTSSSFSSISP